MLKTSFVASDRTKNHKDTTGKKHNKTARYHLLTIDQQVPLIPIASGQLASAGASRDEPCWLVMIPCWSVNSFCWTVSCHYVGKPVSKSLYDAGTPFDSANLANACIDVQTN